MTKAKASNAYILLYAMLKNIYYLCTLYLVVALREGQNRIWLSEKCKYSVVNLAFQNPKFLRYRDQSGLNQGVET